MTVNECINAAESLIGNAPAPDGAIDPRWQAIIAIGEFIEEEPEAVWSFVARWGGSADEDLAAAITTCLLEHLLEHHFDQFIARVEKAAAADPLFGRMVGGCWKFGQTREPERSARFDRLVRSIRNQSTATKLRYVELKTGYSDNGPAWIGYVKISRSGRTIYFNGKALKRTGRPVSGNHYDLETGDEYWISGIKKRGSNRHWAGSGKITIQASAVEEYLSITGAKVLEPSRFVVSHSIKTTGPEEFHDAENE